MHELSSASFRRSILSLCLKVKDGKIIRRVWKILDRAYSAQKADDGCHESAEHAERMALISDVAGQLLDMGVNDLRRVSWYIDQISKRQSAKEQRA